MRVFPPIRSRGAWRVAFVVTGLLALSFALSPTVSATDVESPQTKMLHFLACAPGSTMYDKSATGKECYLQQLVSFPGSADTGAKTQMLFCNTHDLGWKPSTVVISEARWAGGENVGAGSVTYSLRDSQTGAVVAQAVSQLALGLYPPLTGGHPYEIPFPIERPGSYVMTMNYGGATQYLQHMHGGSPLHNVTVNWQPSSSQGVPMRIAECGDDPTARRVGGKRPMWRVTVSDCLLPEFKDQIRYEWVVFGGSASERLTPAGDMSGCSITVPPVVNGKKVSRVEVTRSTFGGARRTTRSVTISGSVCQLPTELSEVDWATMPDSVPRNIRRAMLAQWRKQNPAGTERGSAEEFQAFAASIDNYFFNGPQFAALDNTQNVDMNAAWQAVRESPEELGNLPVYACLTVGNLVDAAGRGEVAVQLQRAAMALLDGVITGAVDTAKTGVSLAALMTWERPLSLAQSLEWWTNQSSADLLEQARAAGISLSQESARQFIATAEEINAAALRGDDDQVARIIGKIGGQAVFDELLALGTVKALAVGGKYTVTPAARKLENALEGMREKFAPSVKKLYRQVDGEFTVKQLRELGIDDFQSQHITAICDELNVKCGVKANDAVGGLKVANGEALPKPEGLAAANSITPEDIALGVDPAHRGEVYFGPVNPPPSGASKAVMDRYEKRRAAFEKVNPDGTPNTQAIRNHEILDWLKQDPATRGGPPAGMRDAYGTRYDYGRVRALHITVEDGIVRDVVTGKPFGPDLDGMVILDARTGKLAAPDVVDEVERRLYPAGMQHGFTAHTRLIPEAKRHAILQAGGGLGDTPMVLFGGRGPNANPVRGYIDYHASDEWLLAHPNYIGK